MSAEVVEYARFAQSMDQWGYEWEAHKVYTEDNYILTTFQILGKSGEERREPNMGSVLVQHGATMDGASWLGWYAMTETKPF